MEIFWDFFVNLFGFFWDLLRIFWVFFWNFFGNFL